MDQEMSLYQDLTAEFPWIELEGGTTIPIIDEEEEKDETKEVVESKRNCSFGEQPQRNDNVKKKDDLLMEGNPDEPDVLKIKEELLSERINEGNTEIEDNNESDEIVAWC